MQIEQISEQLFKTIKSHGYMLQMYTQDGQKTIDPTDARRFYINDLKVMINYINNEFTNEIVINLSSGTDIKSIKPLLTSIRTLAGKYIITYTVKTFGKDITPKDFASDAAKEQHINENFSKWSGTSKKSIQKLEDAKILIKHKKIIDENIRGARTRQIETIFIENAAGERFVFPGKSIPAARAMLKHVNEGGTPYDNFGKHIVETLNEYKQLTIFNRYNKRHNFYESESDITTGIHKRIVELRSNIKQMSTTRGYNRHVESFNTMSDSESSHINLTELQNNVTVHYFDKAITNSLTYVAKIIETVNIRNDQEKMIRKLANMVIKNKVELKQAIDPNDPENPTNQEFSDTISRVVAELQYISKFVKQDMIANMLMQISENLHNVKTKYAELADQIINVITQK